MKAAECRMFRLSGLAALCALSASVALSDGLTLVGDANTRVTITRDRMVYTFLQDTRVKVSGSGPAEVLIVGGGGGAANSCYTEATGGGGGGGVFHDTAFELSAGEFDVVVGAGGAGIGEDGVSVDFPGNNGGDSSAFGIVVKGGGGGGRTNGFKGADGGCGGGSSHKWVDGGVDGEVLAGGASVYAESADERYHGFPGGSSTVSYTAPGGGGAGGAGGNAAVSADGIGGIGYLCSITGKDVYYGTGGNGSNARDLPCVGGALRDQPGADGLGGGAGGAYGNKSGRPGGRGVVIVSVPRSADVPPDSADFALDGGDEKLYLTDGTAHVFRNDGTLTVTGFGFVELLVVGGGGGGGCPMYGLAGGGGGGGAVYHMTGFPVRAGTYPIVVGVGGAEIPAGNYTAPGNNGGDSSAFGVVAKGGGGGAGANGESPKAGGSGGGATVKWSVTDITLGGNTTCSDGDFGYHGFAGGSTCNHVNSAGGGGAGGPAAAASETEKGCGGNGYACSIAGRPAYYGAGGAGGNDAPASLGGAAYGVAGEDGLGAGGGAGIAIQADAGGVGPAGGKGIVIVKYRKLDGVAEVVPAADVSGGDVYRHRQGKAVRLFTQDGTLHVEQRMIVDFLLAGGGGGGGGRYKEQVGGGGGAGGVVTGRVVLAAGDYAVKIGGGGARGGDFDVTGVYDLKGANGGDTMAFGLTAYGGGGGAGCGRRGLRLRTVARRMGDLCGRRNGLSRAVDRERYASGDGRLR